MNNLLIVDIRFILVTIALVLIAMTMGHNWSKISWNQIYKDQVNIRFALILVVAAMILTPI